MLNFLNYYGSWAWVTGSQKQRFDLTLHIVTKKTGSGTDNS